MSKFLAKCLQHHSQSQATGLLSGLRHKSGGKGQGSKRGTGVSPILQKTEANIRLRQSESKFGLPSLLLKDRERRVTFATALLKLLDAQPKILDSIVFTDEGNFWPELPKVVKDGKVKRSYKKKVYAESRPLPTICWCGMTGSEVIGPYFFNSHVTERSYQTMLEKFFLPQLRNRNLALDTVWFQQDGAPAHRSKSVLQFLERTFESRLISYGMPLAWPAKSQDLTPLDYFLWDHLKTQMRTYQPTTHENLRECLSFEIENVPPELLSHFVREFRTRLLKCVQAGGDRFQVDLHETCPPAQNS